MPSSEPQPPPRGRPLSETLRAEMLWAATRLFSERGVAGASTREIAALAGTTERTLFKHFGSKEGLQRAVVDEAVLAHLAPASLEGLTRAIDAYGGDFAGWHRALLLARLEALRATPELSRLLMAELLRDPAQRARFIGLWREAAWDPLVSLFERLQKDGALRGDLAAADLAAQFLRSNMAFLAARLLEDGASKKDDESQVAALASLFLSGAAA